MGVEEGSGSRVGWSSWSIGESGIVATAKAIISSRPRAAETGKRRARVKRLGRNTYWTPCHSSALYLILHTATVVWLLLRVSHTKGSMVRLKQRGKRFKIATTAAGDLAAWQARRDFKGHRMCRLGAE